MWYVRGCVQKFRDKKLRESEGETENVNQERLNLREASAQNGKRIGKRGTDKKNERVWGRRGRCLQLEFVDKTKPLPSGTVQQLYLLTDMSTYVKYPFDLRRKISLLDMENK